jgi:hypothetical protein
MLLTRRKLNQILKEWRLSIPTEVKRDLLEEYGSLAADDEGHLHDYTEQDICEQLRKRLSLYKNFNKEVPGLN